MILRLASADGSVVESPIAEDVPAAAATPEVGPGLEVGAWPAEALRLLDAAEARLREGDYTGFGQALEELRRFLQARDRGGS